MAVTQSHLMVMLHGHLPFVHHPEHPHFLEEDWLFEGLADCYLPILQMFNGWEKDQVDASITMGLSPTLLSMWVNQTLQERAVRYLDARNSLTRRYLEGLSTDSEFRPAALAARDDAEEKLSLYESLERNPASAYANHHHQGRVELITCGATHGLLPVLLDAGSAKAQVTHAINVHESTLGFRPRGIWLPECGVNPMALRALADANLHFTFCESRAVRLAEPPPQYAEYRPIFSPQGVCLFPRDPVAAKEVWSAEEGYPGDFSYREFYRDLGYDAEEKILDDAHRQGTGDRKNVGIKLHRITGAVNLGEKQAYDPHTAAKQILTHAAHFADRRIMQARSLAATLDVDPCIVTSFDAELFGHWWYEGPRFLDATIRHLANRQHESGCPKVVSAVHYLQENHRHQMTEPAVSSWGDGGAFQVWVNEKNDWLWRCVHDARLRLKDILDHHAPRTELQQRAVKQACREVMLAQSSDWPFILTMGTQAGYALKRPVQHLSRAHQLMHAIEKDNLDPEHLRRVETRDGIFPEVDPSPFQMDIA
jgi:1,4-alpha-glucan branching enzyme